MTPVRSHGYSAFELVYKQIPEFPAHISPSPNSEFLYEESTVDDEAAMAEELISRWLEIRPTVKQRLNHYDQVMKQKYLK